MAPSASKAISASLVYSLAAAVDKPDLTQSLGRRQALQASYGAEQETRVPLASEPTLKFFLSAGVMASAILRRNFQIPSGTWTLVMLMGGVFLKPDGVALSASGLLPSKVVQDGEVYRLVVSAFVHMNATHFLLNASSLIDSGSLWEAHMGAAPFLTDVTLLTVLSHGVYVGAAWLEKAVTGIDSTYTRLDATGFSCVAFALGVLTGALEASEPMRYPASMHSPGMRVWGQLLVTSLFLPDSNLLAHISGIAVGLVRLFFPQPFLWIRQQTTKLARVLLRRMMDNRIDEERKLARYRSKGVFFQHLCLFVSSCVAYVIRQRQRAV